MTNNDGDDFADFLRMREAVALAYVNGDGMPLAGISASSDPATFFGPDGRVEQGAARVLDVNLKGADHFAGGGSSRLEVLHSQASTGLAYWVGLQHATVRQAGQPGSTPMTLRVTEIFRQEAGKWVLIHRHADPSGANGALG
jgi:ketosteroid isomerase-like protein